MKRSISKSNPLGCFISSDLAISPDLALVVMFPIHLLIFPREERIKIIRKLKWHKAEEKQKKEGKRESRKEKFKFFRIILLENREENNILSTYKRTGENNADSKGKCCFVMNNTLMHLVKIFLELQCKFCCKSQAYITVQFTLDSATK